MPLGTSAIVCEEEKDGGTSTTKASILFTSYFDSVPYAACQRPRQNFSSFFFNLWQARGAFGRIRDSILGVNANNVSDKHLKKISATQQSL